MDPTKAAVYDTVVFEGPPMTEQTLWPRHCVQDTWGAELHKELKVKLQNSLEPSFFLKLLLWGPRSGKFDQ